MFTICFLVISLNEINIGMTWTAQKKITNTCWIPSWPIYNAETALGTYKNEQRTPCSKYDPSMGAKLQNRGSTPCSARSGSPLPKIAPILSIRAAERQFNIPRSSVQRILRQQVQFLPYRITNHRTLRCSSRNRRLQLEQLALQKRPTPERYLSRVFSPLRKGSYSQGLLTAKTIEFGVQTGLTWLMKYLDEEEVSWLGAAHRIEEYLSPISFQKPWSQEKRTEKRTEMCFRHMLFHGFGHCKDVRFLRTTVLLLIFTAQWKNFMIKTSEKVG